MNLKKQKELKNNIMKTKTLKSLKELVAEKVGPKGTRKRNKYDKEFEVFRLGFLLQQARQQKGLTQEQVAELAGTNKSYISKLEKDLKDVRFSTLQRIIKDGLGGQLQISIKL
jgi:HTH-type transcriptional regulator/antitoxin HipB